MRELIGIPYVKGKIDCWGLCILAFQKLAGVKVDFFKGCDASGILLDEILKSGKSNPMWEAIEKPEKHCLVICDRDGVNEHVGFMLDKNHVLHSMEGYGSRIDKLYLLKKIGYNLEFLRYRGSNGKN